MVFPVEYPGVHRIGDGLGNPRPLGRREKENAAERSGFPKQLRGVESGRQDLNLRPLGPER
jgi:hypothetical protein